jgi:adenylosuccinate lyase
MAVSALDSRVFRNLFGTAEVREIFTDDAYVGFLVEVEAALACAEAAVGVIPADAGTAITDAFKSISLEYVTDLSLFTALTFPVCSFDLLARETDIVGYPVLPLVKQLVNGTPGEMSKYIHWGATTQDIMDDASVLQMKRGLQLVRRELQTLAGTLQGLAQKYRDT